MSNSIENYIENNRGRFFDELVELVKFPSISSLTENNEDIKACAEWLQKHLQNIGLVNTKVYPTAKHPVVYGEWLQAEGQPTLLIYGHYDVQPVDPLELWDNPPFEPVLKDDMLYARGATDNKGQFFAHLKALETTLQTAGKLPVNVKVILEGEEEIGSPSLGKFLKEHTDLLKCDLICVSDSPMFARGTPTICYGLRGLAYLEIDIIGPKKDLHSGSFGGVVANPIEVLTKIVAQLKDDNGTIAIPGFYDKVLPLTELEHENFSKLPLDEEAYLDDIGSPRLTGESEYTPLERTWVRPTLDPNGIIGGFIGEGAKTVIPSQASCKISMRLVPNQNSEEIADLFVEYVKELCPDTVKMTITRHHGGEPYYIPLDSPVMELTARAIRRGFAKEPVFVREGGSIPIVASFKHILGADTVLLPLGLPDENTHSPNEHFYLANFYDGIKTSAYFLEEMAKGK